MKSINQISMICIFQYSITQSLIHLSKTHHLGPLSPTRINFNPGMDKYSYAK